MGIKGIYNYVRSTLLIPSQASIFIRHVTAVFPSENTSHHLHMKWRHKIESGFTKPELILSILMNYIARVMYSV